MVAPSETVLVDDLFEQVPTLTLRIARLVEACPRGSRANASPQFQVARRQGAGRTAPAGDSTIADDEFGEAPEIVGPDGPVLHLNCPLAPRTFENQRQPRVVPRANR